MRIERLPCVDSTNAYIRKYLSGGQDTIVIAQSQSGGRGTKGRSFASEQGGVYLSMLRFYKDFPAKDAFRVMAHAAVAVCRTAERFGVCPQIKWANDVFACGRKLSGILIENGLEDELLRYSIVGIGLNVNNPLTGLESIAIGLSEAAGVPLKVEDVQNELVHRLQQGSDMADYLSYIRFLGRDVRVTEGDRIYTARAVSVLEDGRLLIEEGGRERKLSAAEISLKF